MTAHRNPPALTRMSPGAQLAALIWCAIALSGLTFAGLSALQRSTGYQTRLAQLQERASQIEQLRARAKGDKPAELGAICSKDTRAAAPLLMATIRSAATQAKVSVSNLVVTPGQSSRPNLRALSVEMQGVGRYGPTLRLLQDLQTTRPALVLDSVDLIPRSDALHLELSGRAYCWTHAQS